MELPTIGAKRKLFDCDRQQNISQKTIKLQDSSSAQVSSSQESDITSFLPLCNSSQQNCQKQQALPQQSQYLANKFYRQAESSLQQDSQQQLCQSIRQSQIQQFQTSLDIAYNKNQGCLFYISGLPGTGKTLTVTKTIHQAFHANARSCKDRNGQRAQLLNCKSQNLNLKGLYLAIANIIQQCRNLSNKRACKDDIEDCKQYIRSQTQKSSNRASQSLVVIIIDEFDHILRQCQKEKKQDIEEFLCLVHNSCLTLVTIGNTLDLGSTLLSSKVTKLVNLVDIRFPAYTQQEIATFIQYRLQQLPHQIFQKSAIDAVARKVQTQNGDLRQALTYCQAAIRHLETHNSNQNPEQQKQVVDMGLMMQVFNSKAGAPGAQVWFNQTTSQQIVGCIKSLSVHQQTVLCAVHRLSKRRQDDVAFRISNTARQDENGKIGTPQKRFKTVDSSPYKGSPFKKIPPNSSTLQDLYKETSILCQQFKMVSITNSDLTSIIEILEVQALLSTQKLKIQGQMQKFVEPKISIRELKEGISQSILLLNCIYEYE